MPDRVVKTTLIIDDKGSVRVVKGLGEESKRTEGKLGHLDKEVKGLGKSFGGLRSAVGFGLGALGVGGLAFGLSDIASKTKEVASETEKFHAITGIGTQQSLYYTQALKARGLSGEAVTKAFGFLAKNMRTAELQEQKLATSQTRSAAKGKVATAELGRQAQAFKELGLNLQTFSRLSEAAKLEKITKAFEALPDGIRKTRLERELFGRGGNQLSTVLDKNNLGLSHQIELAKRFFPTIKGGANAINELLEKQAESKMAWEGLEFTLGQKLIPVITVVMGWFSKVAVEIEHGKGTWGELGKAISGVVGFLGEVWSWFSKLVGPGEALRLVVGGLVGVMVVSKVANFANALKTFGGAFRALGLAAPEVWALVAAVLALYEAYKHFHQFQSALEALLGITKTEYKTPTGAPSTKAAVGREMAAGERAGLPRLIQNYLTMAHPSPVATSVAAEALKVELHLDSIKVAETMLHNPRSRREITEAVAKHTLGMAARK